MTTQELKIFRRLVTKGRKEFHAFYRERDWLHPNPVEQIVNDAVNFFHASEYERKLWEGAAYVIGPEEFALLLKDRIRIHQKLLADGRELRNPISAFQKVINHDLAYAIEAGKNL